MTMTPTIHESTNLLYLLPSSHPKLEHPTELKGALNTSVVNLVILFNAERWRYSRPWCLSTAFFGGAKVKWQHGRDTGKGAVESVIGGVNTAVKENVKDVTGRISD
ncbi:hypothetical protein D9613_012714 [Agrocybe pediades]|uniref:Uncharacterized protein n=1 Tax=Agrocybe pediades TaxID=84607 RepID=A0A8H4VK33_9AGAR|nr:hypothetical protein D9613_012714 [Agrocybe pediades]